MEQCKKCGSKNIIMVEYDGMHPDHFDGVSEIDCSDCGVRIGRWTGNELKDGETEPKNGYKKK
jgi:DNA-directed RNA polymerase subunit RPC12/RpoP